MKWNYTDVVVNYPLIIYELRLLYFSKKKKKKITELINKDLLKLKNTS